ncbi:hypothetical protein BCR35DRAFT_79752 [Leucosporidium creatinivorum]|uniref:BTB domain-containing protein n=1 Tax=Leucosporidium creatinivorum TaxID=106004 RepID=A0A1Y2FGA2_9BASI|nr:hypothetical protein BCR35DRAFT_79752 [Leucosporidium creatinivorum]
MSAPSSDLDGLEERTSTKFNAKDADLKLISKDRVVFRAHRLYLEAASPVFKAMFEVCRATGGAQLPSIDLEETTAGLEIGLPYVYPGRVDPFKLSRSRKDDWDVISMFDKYEIARGLEAVLTAFIQRDLLSSDGEAARRACAS